MPPDLVLEIRRWLTKAQHDQRAADALLRESPPITDAAAFHCQQAAEKILKAFLFAHQVEFEKTHDLRVLTVRCIGIDAAFNSFLDQLAALTPFAVRFRYPGPADPTVEQVRSAIEVVARVSEFVSGRLPAETRGDEPHDRGPES